MLEFGVLIVNEVLKMNLFRSGIWGSIRKAVVISMIAVFVLAALESDLNAQVFEDEISEAPVETSKEADPYKLFVEGQDAHEKGDLDRALELYAAALKELPEFPEAEYQRGTIFQSRGLVAEAETSFRNALRYKEDWTLALSALGTILIEKGELDEAEPLLLRSIQIDPMNSPAFIALTDILILREASGEKLREHLGKLVYLTTKAKAPASAWASRSALERMLSDFPSARESLSRAISIDPKNKRTRFEIAELAIATGDYEAAIAAAKSLSSEFPDENGPKLILAKGHALAGNSELALAVLAAAKQDANTIALASAIKADTEVDVAALESALKESPEDVTILSQLCSALRRSDPQRALSFCLKAYELDNENLVHATGFSAALIQLRRYEQAISLLEEIVQRDPSNHTVHANLATAYFQIGRFANAKREYLWITERSPDLAIGFYFLAITHDRLNEYPDAMANYQQFLRIADQKEFEIEIGRTRLRLPILEKQIKNSGKKK